MECVIHSKLSHIFHSIMEAKVTQNQLFEQASIDRSYVQRIEVGICSPTAEVLIRLRRARDCTWNEYLFRDLD